MKDYIKPSFTLAGLFPVALAGSACGITTREMQDIFENDFGLVYTDTALNVTEACQTQYNVGKYCKFTSVETGALKLISS